MSNNWIKKNVSAGAARTDKAVFGLAIDTDLVVGVDTNPHHIFGFDCTFLGWKAKAKAAPTGSTAIIDLNLNGISTILPAGGIVIPAGSTAVQVGSTFAVAGADEDDYLTVDVDQRGSTIPGSGILVYLYYVEV